MDCKEGVDEPQCSYGCVRDAGVEISDMARYDDGLRLFQVGYGGSGVTSPQADVVSSSGWLLPSEMGGIFSATCWFFGRDVYDKLSPKVPFGLIEINVCGTPDQHWASPDAIAQCTGEQSWLFPPGYKDSVHWYGMVVPLLRTVPSGFVWYQGESNFEWDSRGYNCSFPALVSDWRAKWHEGTDGASALDAPFGWVQLNSFGAAARYGVDVPVAPASLNEYGPFNAWAPGFPGIRLAQATTLALPRSFMAVVLDTPVRSTSVHSPYKQEVGARLARGALSVAYGMASAAAVSPVAHSARLVAGAAGQSVEVVVGGVGAAGLIVTSAVQGFEVLGICSDDPALFCWHTTPIARVVAAVNGSGLATIVLGPPVAPLSLSPQAVRCERHLPATRPAACPATRLHLSPSDP